jgi:hypothetical protein
MGFAKAIKKDYIMNDQDKDKKIDSGWKEQARKEKEELDKKSDAPEETPFLPPADFSTLISTTALQAIIGLGQMEHPVSRKKEVDLFQAQYSIDTLNMLKAKTVNNLTPEEAQHLEQTLYALQMLFVKVSHRGKPPDEQIVKPACGETCGNHQDKKSEPDASAGQK